MGLDRSKATALQFRGYLYAAVIMGSLVPEKLFRQVCVFVETRAQNRVKISIDIPFEDKTSILCSYYLVYVEEKWEYFPKNNEYVSELLYSKGGKTYQYLAYKDEPDKFVLTSQSDSSDVPQEFRLKTLTCE